MSAATPATGIGPRLKRACVLAAMAVVAVNIWTGAPLLALWVGSRVVGDGSLTMGAVAVVIGTLALACFVLVKLLGALGGTYDRLLGLPPAPRAQAPWLRSLSGERVSEQRRREHVSALDVILVATVLLAAGAFEVWFFFFSGSPI